MSETKPVMAPERTARALPWEFEKRLVAYAMAAGAGLAVSSRPATAGIVWTDASVPIVGIYNLDLDGDGNVDFQISLTTNTPHSGLVNYYAYLGIRPGTSAGVVATGPYRSVVKVFSPSESVSSASKIGNASRMAYGRSGYSTYISGPLANVSGAYVGLKFKIGGVTYNGFARFDVSTSGGHNSAPDIISATLTGYGYNDVAGAAAHVQDFSDEGGAVPEPGTLGLLAAGAVGLALWRRLKKQPS